MVQKSQNFYLILAEEDQANTLDHRNSSTAL